MGEWTTEQIKELLIDELGLSPLMVDAWLAAHDAEVKAEALKGAADDIRRMADRFTNGLLRNGALAAVGTLEGLAEIEGQSSAPFDLDAHLAEAGLPPFPTIRKEGTDG